jgi:hypothetical protein
MMGKGLQDRMWPGFGIHRPGQIVVQALEGSPDGPDALLGALLTAPGCFAQERGNLLQFLRRLGLVELGSGSGGSLDWPWECHKTLAQALEIIAHTGSRS